MPKKIRATRVLLVDDHDDYRKHTKALLRKVGYYCVAADSCDSALELLSKTEEPFDVLVTDLMMPDKTGLDLLQELPDVSPLLPVVVNTGESNQVSHNFSCRVVTTIFTQHVDAGKIETDNFGRLVRRNMALQIKKVLVHAPGNAAHQELRVKIQRTRKFRNAVNCGRDFFWIRPDTVYGCANCKRLTIAIRY